MTEQPPYGGQPPPGHEQQGLAQGQAGRLGERFGARLIDALIILVAVIIIGVIIAAIGLVSSGGASFNAYAGDSYGESVILAVVQAAIWMGYFVGFETTRGQTLGKMVLKLRVVNEAGTNPTVEQSAKRNIFLAFGLVAIIPFLGFVGGLAQIAAVIAIAVTVSGDPANRGWHDKFGGTQVLKIG